MKGWEKDKRWSDIYIPQVKTILGSVLIGVASEEEDQKRNTDLIVMTIRDCRIGVRIRRAEYLNFKNQFTIRTSRPSSAKTELQKIMEGWGDYFFYGFAHPNLGTLQFWLVGDLEVFRRYVATCRSSGIEPGYAHENRDFSSDFRAYEVAKIPNFVIASNHLKTEQAA